MPKNMSADAMAAGYEELYRRLFSDAAIALCIRNKGRDLRAPLYASGAGDAPAGATIERRMASVRTVLSGYVARGQATVDLRAAPDPHVAIALRSALDRRFFARAGSRLERLLRHTRATLTLRIDHLQASQREHFQRLLVRLARYGDRVSIVADEELRRVVPVDSSVFNLVLARPPVPQADYFAGAAGVPDASRATAA